MKRCSVTKAGAPAAERCNAVDDDCDGSTDEDFGIGQACDGADTDSCQNGARICDGANTWTCSAESNSFSELCNGKNDDCDGAVDEGNPGGGGACTIAGLQGVCRHSTMTCSGGALVCLQTVFPTAEACDGKDNDCDGAADEDNPGGGAACTVAGLQGVCRNSTTRCSGGALVCPQTVFPSAEVCNGKNDDCDWEVDEGNPGGGGACTVAGLQGVCRNSTTRCSGGALVCSQTVFPSAEVCDGEDNDCDGEVDNSPAFDLDGDGHSICDANPDCDDSDPYVWSSCETCGDLDDDGYWTGCDAPRPEGDDCDDSNPSIPGPEICNGLDDDCNGAVDDGAVDADGDGALVSVCGEPYDDGTGGVGDCNDGDPLVSPTAQERCNLLDDDCDGIVDESCTPVDCGPDGSACAPFNPGEWPITSFRTETQPYGSLPGSFGVSGRGTATYSVPLAVPPGRAGIQPSLGLTYDSGRGNGVVGVGWALSGLSQIHRCGKTWAKDGASGDISLDPSDPLCLDGVRLVAMRSSTCDAGFYEYRPESNPALRVCALHGNDAPVLFKVYSPSGRIAQYGMIGVVPEAFSVRHVQHVWPLTQLSDRFGNYVRYTYADARSLTDSSLLESPPVPQVSSDGPFYSPTLIEYTGFGSDPGTHLVSFTYSPRADVIRGYRKQAQSVLGFRLSSIRMLYRAHSGASPELVWKYDLTYDNDGVSHRSRLVSLQQCASDACIPATTFRYQDGSRPVGPQSFGNPVALGSVPASDDGSGPRPHAFFKADAWGDGQQNLVWIWNCNEYFDDLHDRGEDQPWDDRNEQCETVGCPDEPFAEQCLAVWPPQVIVPVGSLQAIQPLQNDFYFTQYIPFDLDKDGTPDLVSPRNYRCPHFARPAGQATPFQVHPPTDCVLGSRDISKSWPGDYDGDGWDELMIATNELELPLQYRSTFVLLRPWATSFDEAATYELPLSISPLSPRTVSADVDGDGKPEVLWSRALSPEWNVLDVESTDLRDGTGQMSDAFSNIEHEDVFLSPLDIAAGGDWIPSKAVDLNGDGLQDLLAVAASPLLGSKLEVWINVGGAFYRAWAQNQLVSYGNRNLSEALAAGQAMDLNGDGRSELVYVEPLLNRVLALTWKETGLESIDLGIVVNDSAELPARLETFDANADGLADLVIADLDGGRLFTAQQAESYTGAHTPDLLVGVRSGLNPDPGDEGLRLLHPDDVSIRYQAPRAPNFYLREPGSDGYLQCDRDLGDAALVSHVGAYQGGAPVRSTSYTYKNACRGREGRGWLGFEEVSAKTTYAGPEQESVEVVSSLARDSFGVGSEWVVVPVPTKRKTTHSRTDDTQQTHETISETVYERPQPTPPPDGSETLTRSDSAITPTLALEDLYGIIDGRLYYRKHIGETTTTSEDGNLVLTSSTATDIDAHGTVTKRTSTRAAAEDAGAALAGSEHESWVKALYQMQSKGTRSEVVVAPSYDERRWTTTELTTTVSATSAYCQSTSLSLAAELGELDGLANVCPGVGDGVRTKTSHFNADTGALETTEEDATTVTFTYTPYGLPETITVHGPSRPLDGDDGDDDDEDGEPQSRVTTLGYDAEEHAFATSITSSLATNPAGMTSRFEYDPRTGAHVASRDPNGVVALTTIDGLGRVTGGATAGGGVVTYELGTFTDETGVAFPEVTMRRMGGLPVRQQMDRLGRVTNTLRYTAPDIYTTQSITYDQFGKVASTMLPDGIVLESHFDALGRLEWTTTPDDTYHLEYAGLATRAIRDSDAAESWSLADAMGRTIGTIGPVTDIVDPTTWMTKTQRSVTRAHYGAFGQLWLSVYPDMSVRTQVSDPYGRAVTVDDPDRGHMCAEANAFGETVRVRRGNCVIGAGAGDGGEVSELTTDFFYDSLGRVTMRTDTRPNHDETPTFTTETTRWVWDTAVNGKGALDHSESADGIVKSYTYDEYGRVSSVATGGLPYPFDELSVGFEYDFVGRLQRLIYPTVQLGSPLVSPSLVVRQSYDEAGRLSAVTEDDSSGQTDFWRALQRDPMGRLLEERLGDWFTTTTTFYAENGQPESMVTTAPDGTRIQDLTWTYAAGRVRSTFDGLAPSGGTTTYKYDALDRLTKAQSGPEIGPSAMRPHVTYDIAGNATYRRSAGLLGYGDPDHVHAITEAGGSQYASYDAFGNQTGRSPDDAIAITYTPFDRPRTVTGPELNLDLEFKYDADGARVVTRDGTVTTVNIGRLYEAAETASGIVERQYIANDRRVVAARLGDTGETFYIQADRLGTTTSVAKAGEYSGYKVRYDAYGNVTRRDEGFPEAIRIGFTGHWDQPRLGLIDMINRDYDPVTGQFTTTDPLVGSPGMSQALNPYMYVMGQPTRFVDPFGLTNQQPEVMEPAPSPMNIDYTCTKCGTEETSQLGDDGAWHSVGSRLDCYPVQRAGSVSWWVALGDALHGQTRRNGPGREGPYTVSEDMRRANGLILSPIGAGKMLDDAIIGALYSALDLEQDTRDTANIVILVGSLFVNPAAAEADAVNLAKQLGSEAGVAELLSGGGRAIAGAGTYKPIRDIARLVAEHGGNAADWAKVSSTAQAGIEIHAYRNVVTGLVVEFKSIIP